MQKFSDTIATTKPDGTIEVLPSATVTVYLAGTTTPASIYSTNTGTAKTNPFLSAASTGRIEFYAADGRYDLRVDKAGYATVSVLDVLLEDPDNIDDNLDGVTISNSTLSSCILLNATVNDVDSVSFSDTPDALTPRRMAWNADEGTLDVALDNSTTLQLGQELHYRARNATAATIADGAVVWATGTTGASGRISVGLAVADGSQPGKTVMGLMTHATAAGSDGYVAAFGKVRGINTTGSAVGETWVNGDILYLHPTIPGALTKVKPAVNGHIVVTVAIVIYAGNNGTLFARPTADSQEADEIRYTPAGTDAVATTVQAKLRETVSVKDFKCSDGLPVQGDGIHDDTTGIQAAWSSCVSNDKNLFFPAGIYRITNTLTEKPIVFHGEADSALIFENFSGKNGITYLPSDKVGQLGGIVNMQLVAKGQNGATCIELPKNETQYNIYFTRWVFSGLYCRGTNRNTSAYGPAWDFGFAKWIRVGDCSGIDIENIVIQGQFDIKLNPVGQFADIGIELDAASAILTARISDLTIGPIHTAINVGDRAFYSMSTFDFLGTFRGVYQSGSVVYNEPKIAFGNINAQDVGIFLDGPDARDIDSVTIRRHSDGWKGGSAAWYGVKAANSTNLNISRCTIQPDESGGAFTGTMTAIDLSSCSLGICTGNYIGAGNDIGYNLSNCTGGVIDQTVSAQNAASDVLFNLTSNTRITTVGLYELVSTFAGTVLQKDGTIVGAIQMINKSFDLQNTGNVVADMTRVNAAADSKKWRTIVGTTQGSRQVVSDAGLGTNYEIVTRTGTTVDSIEWRATKFKYNNGPELLTGSGSPEGVVIAPIGSLYLNISGGSGTTLYVKQSGTGNTGWGGK